ncbi:MAG: collagen binding domain-containing protein, partial [Lachnospirales bacterium]
YELDQTVHTVTVREGVQETLKITNTPKAGLRIKKIDSVTKLPIYGVEFRLYDFETKKEVGGPYYTDNNGVVDFEGIIDAGRYTIKETEPAPNYIRDDVPKTVEFKEGTYTEIVWENTPLMGQIQITKKSATDNYTNGLPAGTPLADAVFEVYDYKTGNTVDQFITKADGVGVSRPLPLGRYIVKEIKAPIYYSKSDKELDVTLEFSSQILKYEFTNESANLGVTIKKVGPSEVMNGQEIKYDIKTVQNNSSVSLTDFYFRDVVPKEIRLSKIVTGTYNQGGTYKIMFKTNKNDYRVAYDNLSTTTNNVIDMSPAALGIYSDEYITEMMFVFGNVKAGFMQVETPAIYGNVTGNLPNGYQFANKVDIGGKYDGEWVIGNSTWVTTIYNPSSKLPRTGY